MSYVVNTRVSLTVTFTNTAGTPTSPTTVVLTVVSPSGTVSTPVVSNTGTGTYSAEVTLSEPGIWRYSWQGSGTLIAASDGRVVARSAATERYE